MRFRYLAQCNFNFWQNFVLSYNFLLAQSLNLNLMAKVAFAFLIFLAAANAAPSGNISYHDLRILEEMLETVKQSLERALTLKLIYLMKEKFTLSATAYSNGRLTSRRS